MTFGCALVGLGTVLYLFLYNKDTFDHLKLIVMRLVIHQKRELGGGSRMKLPHFRQQSMCKEIEQCQESTVEPSLAATSI